MGILDEYKKAVEDDVKNQNNDAPVEFYGEEMTEEERKMYEKRLNEMREQISNKDNFGVDCEKAFNVEDPYKKVEEKDLKTDYVKVTPMIKRAYCPECGKEIVNTLPSMYNPFSFEKVNRFECDCGWKANLEYSYPRVVFVTDNGTQIEAFAK